MGRPWGLLHEAHHVDHIVPSALVDRREAYPQLPVTTVVTP